jgi:hypothetical protein
MEKTLKNSSKSLYIILHHYDDVAKNGNAMAKKS